MASGKDYLEYILEQLSDLEDITWRPMMGEYIIYYRDRIIGGIYDDRFLLKPVPATLEILPDAEMDVPYEGAKEMILVENVDDSALLCELVSAVYEGLPSGKKRGPAKKKA